jgi:hypothetical protein
MIRIDTIKEFDALEHGPAKDLRYLRLIRDGHADSLRRSIQARHGTANECSAGDLDEMVNGEKHKDAAKEILAAFFSEDCATTKQARETMAIRAKAVIFIEVCDRIRDLERDELAKLKAGAT